MRLPKIPASMILLLLLVGCVKTTGDIKENKFYVENDFSVGLLDSDWQVIRQTVNPMLHPSAPVPRQNTPWQISFSHKKSNGFIAVGSWMLTDVGQARPLEVLVDSIVADSGGLKLSEQSMKIDGNDAIELVISGKYMTKQIILKKGKRGYRIVYSNSPAYFDQYLGVFDAFVETFRAY